MQFDPSLRLRKQNSKRNLNLRVRSHSSHITPRFSSSGGARRSSGYAAYTLQQSEKKQMIPRKKKCVTHRQAHRAKTRSDCQAATGAAAREAAPVDTEEEEPEGSWMPEGDPVPAGPGDSEPEGVVSLARRG
jgi:hypothetical protein